MPDFLLELGTEEIPAGYIAPALEAFEVSFRRSLEDAGLGYEGFAATATPRRLIFFAKGLPAGQREREAEVAGPPARIAFDAAGKPTRAAEGFARAQGVGPEALVRKMTDKGEYLFARKRLPARSTRDVLAAVLPELVRGIPFPKSMYWRGVTFRFARPLRRVLALLGDEVVEFEVNGVKSSRLTAGHPFLAPGPFEVATADLGLLEKTLHEAFVLADRKARRAKILSEVEGALAAHGSKLEEWELLEEVTDLVEWPELVEGSFSEDYLILPEEVAAAAMMEHQRYFPVRDGNGRLVNRFLTISNRPKEFSEGIREGNERVLAARLNDARFFWNADLKRPLEKLAEGLSSVTYLAGLGTVADKVERMKRLVSFEAGATGLGQYERAAVEAAGLSKADLLTEMVFEFPALQGVMGRAYALAQGRDRSVAMAIEEHYLPRTLSGKLPETVPGKLVAIADKADTLAGAFVMGLVPSGSQDPYGLRRASVGIVRIATDGRLHLKVSELFAKAWQLASAAAGGGAKAKLDDLTAFFRERIYQYYLDRGARHDILRACLAPGFDDLVDFAARLDAVTALSKEPFWPELVTAVERTYNITKGYDGPEKVDASLLAEKEERVLWDLFTAKGPQITRLFSSGDYLAASRAYLETFGQALHTFFDKVFVNVEDERVRSNRLALVKGINRLYSTRAADLALVVQEGAAKNGG